MSEIIKQVFAMGDGGLDDKTPVMDIYILAQSKKTLPKVCFLPTASGDNGGLVKYFYELYKRYPCEPSHFSVFNPSTKDVKDFLLSKDIILVGGGQTKSMLGVWKEWGVDKFLREAYENGTILAGGSAGSVCWFDQCVTDSLPGSLTVMNCLGILPYSNCPHFGSRDRQEAYFRFVTTDEIKEGYAADDFAAVHFVNGKVERCVSSRQYAKVYKLGKDTDGRFYKKKLKTRFLGEKQHQDELIWSAPCFAYLNEEEEANSESTETEEILQSQEDKSTPRLPESTNATDSDPELQR